MTRSTASGRSSSRRSAATRTIPPSTPRSLFQTALFGAGPLGREICGDEAGIRALPEATIREFWRTTYRPTNTVIAVAGDIEHDAVVDLATTAFGAGNGAIPGFEPAPVLPAGERTMLGKRQTAQAQLVVGLPALRRDHPDSWTLTLLNTVLGDGMSSRLFLSVREDRGLAYDIGSGLVEYADAGALEVSAGVDPASLREALTAILDELARIRDELVPADELGKAKRYLSGGLELRMEETRHVASWIGGQEALHDRVLTVEEALAAIEAVTATDIQRVAETLLRDEGLRLCRRRAGPVPARARPAPAAVVMTDGLQTTARSSGRPRARPRPPADRVTVARPGRARDPGRTRRARRRTACSTSPRRAGGRAISPVRARPRSRAWTATRGH